ncbi:MAG: thiamine phosphate synthase [Sarcina sp.]
MKDIGLYLVTDSDILKDRDFYEAVEEALKAGVKVIQLREKNLEGRLFLEKAMNLRVLTRKYNTKLIINDRVDIAILCDADGVHVGQNDIAVEKVRKLIGSDKIIGLSVANLEEAKVAKESSVDYLGVGAIFNTSTKLDARAVSNEQLREIKAITSLPIVAIGGLTLENISEIEYCDGYAVISDILAKKDITEHCEKFILKIKDIRDSSKEETKISDFC